MQGELTQTDASSKHPLESYNMQDELTRTDAPKNPKICKVS